MNPVTVIGAGLAGAEAAWQLARGGIPVRLWEMRPAVMTPAHQSDGFAELVCSNSLRGASLENAVGLLKEEMRRLDSLIMAAADATSVPAGGALAVDRHQFSAYITRQLTGDPSIEVIRAEADRIPEGPAIIASGPLTSPLLAEALRRFFGADYLYFYDAAAPIVTAESINHEVVFAASRYDKGDIAAYLNAPFSKEEYLAFWNELCAAETATGHLPEERAIFFEGCMPIEVLARRGTDAIRYGPLKPVGLTDPRTSRRPYAVVQLRAENREGSLYNLVGFQTHLKWGEQQRVFRMIPGLEQAEFMRYGVMHRNTYINSPQLLLPTLQTRSRADLFLAGQITGVEGYVESAAAGLVAGLNCQRLISGEPPLTFPRETATGALLYYISTADSRHFQPMNVNFGLFPPLEQWVKGKRERYQALAERSLQYLPAITAR